MVVGRCSKLTYSRYMLVGRADLMSCDGGDRAKECGINPCLEDSCCSSTQHLFFCKFRKSRKNARNVSKIGHDIAT
jgi:hypothetical protein